MKQIAILFVAICAVGVLASESQAQHYRGHGNHGHGGGFAIGISNGYSGFSYSNIGSSYGGYYGRPAYRPRPVYAAPVYRSRYGGGGGYYGGNRSGCGHGGGGGGGIFIGW